MEVIKTAIPGVLVFKPKVYGDSRGFFLESYQEKRYKEAGLPDFIQDNHSRSRKGILRGMHCQRTFGQGKLVRVSRGKVLDVAVDIRADSETFGKWVGTILDDETHTQMYIPPGFAHGFYVLSDIADFLYKCTQYYYPEDEIGIRWNDPDVGIDWPIEGSTPTLSERDATYPFLRDLEPALLPRFK